VLGFLTGLMGVQSIAIATVAVERVVLQHLQQQLLNIGITDPDATAAISAILSEEQYHHDQSATRILHAGIIDRMLGSVISAATELVIWIGMRI
jgi:ubiquinone biosynthesis monooxygenase Coq7